jgi:hypothetical protein
LIIPLVPFRFRPRGDADYSMLAAPCQPAVFRARESRLRPDRKRLVAGSRDGVMRVLARVFLSMIMVYNRTGLVQWLLHHF